MYCNTQVSLLSGLRTDGSTFGCDGLDKKTYVNKNSTSSLLFIVTFYLLLLESIKQNLTWKPDLILATEHLDPHVSH